MMPQPPAVAPPPNPRLRNDAPTITGVSLRSRVGEWEVDTDGSRLSGGLGAAVRVTDRCTGCGACLLTCPEHALRPTGHTGPGAEPLMALVDRCTGCGECIEICPADAIDGSDGLSRPALAGWTS